MDDDGFTIVKSKGRTPRRQQSGRDKGKAVSRLAYDTRGQTSTFYGGSTSEDKLEKVLAILQTRRRQLLDDDQASGKGNTFLKRWKDQMSQVRSVLTGDDDTSDPSTTCQTSMPVQIVCLGIGIVNESRESQFQLVLLDMLREALEIPPENVWVYDPLFQPVDLALLKSRGYQLIPKNECGKHKLDPEYQTLAYMPHCPGKLYDAFLRENWNRRLMCSSAESSGGSDNASGVEQARRSGRVVLLANDFRGYIENAPRSQIQNELPSLYRLTPHLSTIPLPTLLSGHIASNAFNSLIFQYLDSARGQAVDWDTIPPVGWDKEGVTETEVIASEIQDGLEFSIGSLSLQDSNN
ncbi:hypothetical protein QFC24_004042 [Naganishia onofrii]|uniref:Uncharacterized protein n=1 Tax=Naganishia onofrii TaxID=1851511 RepID=A0ACC2XH94_9TREE|nr:hypothetical protein QFC24_004042 [Naganishia onofrii]